MNIAKKITPSVEDALSELDTVNSALAPALVKALSEIEGVTKDKVNPHFKSKYADLSSVLETIRPVFAKYGMAVTQETSPSEDGVIVETVVLHSSGEERRFGQLFVPANKRDAQGAGSALTYARRYSLVTAFGVPTEDDDGNAAVKSTARPSEGATRPVNGVDTLPNDLGRGEGEMSSSALRASLRMLVHHINGSGSVTDLEDILDTEDAKEVIDNCQRRFPAWWETGEGMPAEFVPLKKLIEQTRHGLKQLETQ
jgi:hypothetical protein